MIIYTDIHGCFDTWMALRDSIPKEERDKGEVVAGDLVDRGPKSMEIIQFCIDNSIPCVRGNHEDMMLEFLDGYKAQGFDITKYPEHEIPKDVWWLGQGGHNTLASYSIKTHYDEDGNFWPVANQDFQKEVFEKHIEWLRNLPYFLEFKDVKNEDDRHLLITHASASKSWKMRERKDFKEHWEKQFNLNVSWNRDPRIKDIPGIYNVFGHTPEEFGPKIKKIYANIDTGACYGRDQWAIDTGLGVLTALQFPDMKIYQQTYVEKF